MSGQTHVLDGRHISGIGAIGSRRPLTAPQPQLAGAWWWLDIPVVLIIVLPLICWLAPEIYREWVLPEGYGFLELLHFFVPLVGFVLGLRLLLAKSVRANRLWWVLILLGTLACLYTAGEEQSWGQHLFGWHTPDAWSQLNKQDETNLHNVSGIFNVLPRFALELAILVLGLIIPLASVFTRPLHFRGLEPFMPSLILVPVSIGALVYKIDATVQKSVGIQGLVFRPSEAAETFYVLFMLFYMILITRRIAVQHCVQNNQPLLDLRP